DTEAQDQLLPLCRFSLQRTAAPQRNAARASACAGTSRPVARADCRPGRARRAHHNRIRAGLLPKRARDDPRKPSGNYRIGRKMSLLPPSKVDANAQLVILPVDQKNGPERGGDAPGPPTFWGCLPAFGGCVRDAAL